MIAPLMRCPTCRYDLRSHGRWGVVCPECGSRAVPRRFGVLRVVLSSLLAIGITVPPVGSLAALLAGPQAYLRVVPLAATVVAALVGLAHALSTRKAHNARNRRRDTVATFWLALAAYGLVSVALTPALKSWDLPIPVRAGSLPAISGTDSIESLLFLLRLSAIGLALSPILLPFVWLLREVTWRAATTSLGRHPWPQTEAA